jgi:hypothetical protein
MTQQQEKEVVDSLKSIAYSLDMLVRHAQLGAMKMDWPAVPPPQHK